MEGNSKLIAAGVIVGVYFIVAGVLLFNLYNPGKTPPDWDHVLTIFNAIGALATAAAGVLLGVQIQQGHLDSVKRDRDGQAAEATRKDNALRQALTQLHPVNPAGVAEVSAARQTLQQAIG